MKTQYTKTLEEVIKLLKEKLNENLADQDLRFECGNILFWAHKQVASQEEKEFSRWLLNTSADVETIFALDESHPNYHENIQCFRDKIENVILELQAYLPETAQSQTAHNKEPNF